MGRRGKKGVTGSAGPKGVPGVKGVTGPPGADGEIVGDIYSLFNIYYKLTWVECITQMCSAIFITIQCGQYCKRPFSHSKKNK